MCQSARPQTDVTATAAMRLHRLSRHWLSVSRTPRYLIVGLFNTGLGYGVFALCWLSLGSHIPYILVLAIAHITAVSVSFLTHRYWVFNAERQSFWAEFMRFQVSYIWLVPQSLLLNASLVYWLHCNPWLAQALTMVMGVGAAFLMHRFFVFRGRV